MKKKILVILTLIMLLICLPSGIITAADDTEEEGYLYELTGTEIDKFLTDLDNPDIDWRRSTHGYAYLRPAFQKGVTEFIKAPGGGITVSGRDVYWHSLEIRHEWMQEDYTYDIEIDFKADTPVTFAITNIPGPELQETEILELTLEPVTAATLKYTLSNDNRTLGQRGIRLTTLPETDEEGNIIDDAVADFTVTAIRINHGEIFIFPWTAFRIIIGVTAALFIAFIVWRSVTNERFYQKLPDRVFVVLNTIFMIFVVIIMLYPFLNVLAISFNNAKDSIKGGIYLWPRIFTLANYEQVFKNPNLITAFQNSIARTVLATVGGLLVCSMAAYVLSRREFMWNKFVTVYFLLTMYVSAGLIPTFFLYRDLGLVNNFNVYWVPGLFGAFNVIVIRTFMQGLPDSLVEAGRLDGAGEFRIFAQIILPICKPVLATVGLWMAVGNWNDWFTSFIYAPYNADLTTLQYELWKELANTTAMMGQQASEALANQGNIAEIATVTPIAIRSAITIVATVPILCVYPFLQKYFVKGVHVGSVKG